MAEDLGNYSLEQLRDILKQFKLSPQEYFFNPLQSGLINDTFLVRAADHPEFILQRINQNVFENVEGLMTNLDRALKKLKGASYTRIKLISATSGKMYASLPSGYWRVMTYIPNSVTYNTSEDPKIAFEAGRIIGKFHVLLASEKNNQYADTIYKFHDLEFRKMQFLAAVARATQTTKNTAEKGILLAHQMLEEIQDLPKNLPHRICHNDTKLNNILFSKTTNKALCLIDLDTIMKGYFHYDIGDAVRTLVNTAAEDEQNHAKINFRMSIFEAFIEGLFSNKAFLSEDELKSIPAGVILMPFLHGIRALTDFLNNNLYYKVSYENQNLDRALSLFDFTQKAIEQKAPMEKVVSKYLQQVK